MKTLLKQMNRERKQQASLHGPAEGCLDCGCKKLLLFEGLYVQAFSIPLLHLMLAGIISIIKSKSNFFNCMDACAYLEQGKALLPLCDLDDVKNLMVLQLLVVMIDDIHIRFNTPAR